ncbi:MAG: leucyl aminopeptidase [Ottowia sp.]|nr:leucyl aminopeptidase [Ottowia sp.]
MEFSIKEVGNHRDDYAALLASRSACLILGMFEDEPLETVTKMIDRASAGLLSRLVKTGEASGKRDTHVLLHEVAEMGAARVLIVGLGKKGEFNERAWVDRVRYTLVSAESTHANNALWLLPVPNARDVIWSVRMAVQVARAHCYQFIARHPGLKSRAPAPKPVLSKVVFAVPVKQKKLISDALTQGVAIANGMDLTRDLANLPANICTPSYLADRARELARKYSLKIEVLEQKQMAALKMGALLAVTQGSVQPPKLIVLKYQGGPARQAPIVLVGKGITFDSGGISLKPGEGMDEMKFDMCGAASVLGTLLAAVEMKLPQNIVVVVPTCENMPSGAAVKPGDVVVSMSGQTIEVLNTDAEGRLILCDALTYVERFKPSVVIDVATLTGACVIALGNINSGLYARDDALAAELLNASKQSLDGAWRMPLDEAYQDQLKSNFADMANIGGRPAGSVTAACFLERYTRQYNWAHLDIAGTAWKSGTAKGATARPVPLLTQFLLQRG